MQLFAVGRLQRPNHQHLSELVESQIWIAGRTGEGLASLQLCRVGGHSFTHRTGPYCEGLDWIKFKKQNNYDQMQFRIDTIRAAHPNALITAHGVAGSITDMAARGSDDWLAASKVEVYGYTWIAARKGAQPWRNFFAANLIRGASRGKLFWHAERQGGPLCMQPQVLGRDKEDGRVATPEDIRLWSCPPSPVARMA